MNQYMRHIENKDRTLRNGGSISVLKNTSDLDTIGQDVPYYFLKKKAEKLSTAVYLVTGFLSDSEPMKWQIRECGLSILSDVISAATPPMSEMSLRVKSAASGIGKIISLFEIAAAAGFISGMNLSILKEEYLSLAEVMENQKAGKPEGGYVFSREFFESREAPSSLITEKKTFAHEQAAQKHFSKDNEIVRHDSLVQKDETPNETPSSGISDISDINLKNTSTAKLEKVSRRDTVLSLIKDKGAGAELSIKDISDKFSDCGEKTIQRELNALVGEGILKKTGERRWSRYSFV